jgi:hypothetical protein
VKIASYALPVLLASALLGAQGAKQDTKKQRPTEGTDMLGRDKFATKWQVAKGSVGVINEYLCVIVRSESNELILKPMPGTELRWTGQNATKAELVIVYQDKVWSSQSLPQGFDLSKAVVVSFESDKIRYFDFQVVDGGYYQRFKD